MGVEIIAFGFVLLSTSVLHEPFLFPGSWLHDCKSFSRVTDVDCIGKILGSQE